MLNPFIHLISNIISLVNLALIVWVVISLLIQLDIVNRHNPLVARVYATLSRIFEPMLRPIRRQLDRWLPNLGVDLSAIVFILLLHFVDNAMYTWFYTI
jgi:YggT family protein